MTRGRLKYGPRYSTSTVFPTYYIATPDNYDPEMDKKKWGKGWIKRPKKGDIKHILRIAKTQGTNAHGRKRVGKLPVPGEEEEVKKVTRAEVEEIAAEDIARAVTLIEQALDMLNKAPPMKAGEHLRINRKNVLHGLDYLKRGFYAMPGTTGLGRK